MSSQLAAKLAVTARVVCRPRRQPAGSARMAVERRFKSGETVRSTTEVKNDGIYPHRDIGETLVENGDAGVVHEGWSFLGEIYYTVEFGARAVVVIMRGREIVKGAPR